MEKAMTEFTPLASLIGGLLIGLSAVLLMAWKGRIAGISGIASRILPPYSGGRAEFKAVLSRLGFVLGLVGAPLLYRAVTGQPVLQTVSNNLWLMGIAGLLVGFGAVLGNGCTSGHGVCGLARLSQRSLVATLAFMASGFATVFLMRHIFGA